MLLLIGFGLLFGYKGITGNVAAENYTYTKAVCNESKYCEDYEVTCNGSRTIFMKPTGNAIQFSEDWNDPRNKDQIEKTC